MSKHKGHKDDPSQDQDQLQAQLEAQLQGQLQGQGELQAQGQGQGQGQGQDQYQAQLAAQGVAQGALQYSENASKNENDNKNENSNDNKLENSVDNKLDNSVDNKVDNSLDNKVENTVENKIENNVETNVDVDVKVDLDLSGLDLQPAIDVEDLDGILFQMPDHVEQGGTNNFNIDQVNNLIDNDKIDNAQVLFKAEGYGGSDYCCDADAPSVFSMSAKAEGGYAKIDDAKAEMTDGTGASIAADASASLTQDAFTQSIVMGANIQFNSVTINLAGENVDTGSEG